MGADNNQAPGANNCQDQDAAVAAFTDNEGLLYDVGILSYSSSVQHTLTLTLLLYPRKSSAMDVMINKCFGGYCGYNTL